MSRATLLCVLLVASFQTARAGSKEWYRAEDKKYQTHIPENEAKMVLKFAEDLDFNWPNEEAALRWRHYDATVGPSAAKEKGPQLGALGPTKIGGVYGTRTRINEAA